MPTWNDRRRMANAGVIHPTQEDVDDAYAKGRRDEHSRHPGHPILSLAVVLVAVIGGAMLFLAAREGSFARGGHIVDTQIAGVAHHRDVARQDAAPPEQALLIKDDASR